MEREKKRERDSQGTGKIIIFAQERTNTRKRLTRRCKGGGGGCAGVHGRKWPLGSFIHKLKYNNNGR